MESAGHIPSSSSSSFSSSLYATYSGSNVASSSQQQGSSAPVVGNTPSSRSTFRAFLPPAGTAALPTTDLIPGLDELAALHSTLASLRDRVGLTSNRVRRTRDSARSRRESLRTKAQQEVAELESLALASADKAGAVADTESEEGQLHEDNSKATAAASASSSQSAASGPTSSSSPAKQLVQPSASAPRQAVPITAGSPLSASEIAARAFYSHNRADSKDSITSQPRSIADLPNIPLRSTHNSESPSLPQLSAKTSPVPEANSLISRSQQPDPSDPIRTVGIPSAATSPLTSALSTASPPIGTDITIAANAGRQQGSVSPVLSAAELISNTSKDKKRKRESSTTPGPTVATPIRAGSNTSEAEAGSAGAVEAGLLEQVKTPAEIQLVEPSGSAASSTIAFNTPAVSTPVPAATPTAAAAAAAAASAAAAPRLAVKLKLNPASRTHFQNAAAAAAAARAAGGSISPGPGPSTPITSTAFTGNAGGRDSSGASTGASGLVVVPLSLRPGRIGPDGRMVDFPPHPEEPPTLSWALPPRTPSSVIPKRPVSQPPKPYARAPEQVQIDWTRWDWKAGVLGMNPVIGSARAGTPGAVGDDSVGTPGPSHDSLARQATRKDKKGKEIQQTPIATFYAYTDAFFKTLTEDDLAWLSTESDDPQPFQMPPLGRYYRDVWSEEDAATMAAAAAAGYDTSSLDLSSGSWGANARGRTGSTPSGFFGTPGPDDSHGGTKRGGNANSNRRRTRSSTLGGLVGGGTGGVYSNMQAVHFTPAQLRDAHLFRDEEAKGGPLTERIVSALMPVAEEEVEVGGDFVPSANALEVSDGVGDEQGRRNSRGNQEGTVDADGEDGTSGTGPNTEGTAPADLNAADMAPARASSPLKYRLKQEPGTEGEDVDPDTEGEGNGGLLLDRRAGDMSSDARADKAAQEQDLASFESRLALELRAISVLSPTEAGNAAAAASAAKLAVSRDHDDDADDAMDLDADGEGDDDGGSSQGGGGGRSSKTGAGSSLPFFEPALRTDDEISSALRQAQRALREQMTINSARKKRLFEVAHDRMAYQDFANALHSVEKDVEQHWYKRQRQQKARREREKEAAAAGRPRPRVAGGGGGGPVTHAEIAAAALAGGYSSSSSTDSPMMAHATLPGGPTTGQYAGLPEPLAAALERRQKLKYAFDPLFLDVCPHSWKTPEESVFSDLKVGKNSGEGSHGGSRTAATIAPEGATSAHASTGVEAMTGVEQDS